MTFTEIRKNKYRNDSVRKTANELGISRSAFSRYETYERFPKKEILKKIQKVYNLTNEDIATLFLNYYLH
ncbi:helix-turn-helix domain-containing protein [Clostridium sp.]|uniref:helix-turn-helix domain-containing protein n=1 Tax=Clostridium sp. TaxID=1506 RepID=UPI003993C335